MRLQTKFILHNSIIKFGIIGILTIALIGLVDRVSENNLKERIREKQGKLLRNLSKAEIENLLRSDESFTDYNILKEEYIIVSEIAPFKQENIDHEHFTIADREIEGKVSQYLILTNRFKFDGQFYKLEIGVTTATRKQIEASILMLSLFVLGASTLFTFIADYLFVKRLMSPFYKIIDKKMKLVNDPEHFNFTPVATNTTDFIYLDENINGMMRKILAQFSLQKQFTSNVSHELLTPISILRSRLENILGDEQIPLHLEEKLLASLKTLNRLKAIINSLLMISKIENSQYSKTDELVISDIIDDVYEDLEDRFDIKGVILDKKINADFSFKGNKSLIHTLFMNIINNGIKYNKTGGTLTITDALESLTYTVFIKDEGRGMSAEMIHKAFNRFEKLGSDVNESYGLGLAIAKTIAHFHHITLNIVSQPPHGCTFVITFPLVKSQD